MKASQLKIGDRVLVETKTLGKITMAFEEDQEGATYVERSG